MWIPSKLTRPNVSHHAIVRLRVLGCLQHAKFAKLVLFVAPAGYGKTTAASMWLADKLNIGWYSIDENDNTPHHFISYFLRALNNATRNSCRKALSVAEKRQFSSLHSLFADVLASLVNFREECYIAIDDFHWIDNDEITESLRFFLKHLPSNITLVITSRTIPALGIANLRVRDQVIEIDTEQLAFDTKETVKFFSQKNKTHVEQHDAESLNSYVEGWPCALQLVALQFHHDNRSLKQATDSISSFNHEHLWDYLAEEAFCLLDEETKMFLMQCAVLDHFNDELAQALTGHDDALSRIELLHRSGMFIQRLEGDRHWYKFHNLFVEFLSHQRRTLMPLNEAILHKKACQAWLKQHTPIEALKHARQANDSELIAQVLHQYGWDLFNNGELSNVEMAIEHLDDDHLYKHPQLCLLRAWLAQSQHKYEEVGALLHTTDLAMSRLNIDLSTMLQGEFNALKAQVAINQNDPEKALQLAELALSQVDQTSFHSRIVATSVIAEVHHVLGNLDRALPMMQQTEKLARQYQVYHHALWAIIQQSEILFAQGYAQASYDIQDSGFKLIDDHQLHQIPLHEFLLRLRAQILWSWNRLEEAESCAIKGIAALGHQLESKHLHCYSLLARIALRRGELDRAKGFIARIETLLNESSYHVDWTANASMSLLLYWQHTDDTHSIQRWLESATRPEKASNHFLQLQWRNIVRAHVSLGQVEQAQKWLNWMQDQSGEKYLVTDSNKNLLMSALISDAQSNRAAAKAQLLEALKMSNQTGILGYFLMDGTHLQPVLNELLESDSIGELEQHKIKLLLKEIALLNRSNNVHFSQEFVEKLIKHTDTPELVRTSPLTQREWQVLGLIYSGFSNEQIAGELGVAGTTIKTHIRNVYQKLNIANRKEAIKTAESFVQLIGY
ncbi:HTH-type transcriptional regulator MalT [Vibrio sp. S4M6]|uniref:HTH-type transcriptional regulator MalT n=1 Tax=Vibrio sinus TaxID=2946865 RepID=UPI00202A85D4|nr:HTH-type transcriptional regulator MalT [Vibrio sinus]MCL9781681.1 HTH-type transcriptional regulator MalT [Vibrio sinus]